MATNHILKEPRLQAENKTEVILSDLFEKCYRYDDPQKVRELGVYPYFHPVQSPPGDGWPLQTCLEGNLDALRSHPHRGINRPFFSQILCYFKHSSP